MVVFYLKVTLHGVVLLFLLTPLMSFRVILVLGRYWVGVLAGWLPEAVLPNATPASADESEFAARRPRAPHFPWQAFAAPRAAARRLRISGPDGNPGMVAFAFGKPR